MRAQATGARWLSQGHWKSGSRKKTRLVLVWPLLKALWALWASLLTRKRGWQNDTPNFTQGPT